MGDEGAETLNLPSSSAERDHGFCERLRKSPRSAETFLPGEGDEMTGPSTLDCERASERSNTDLKWGNSVIIVAAFPLRYNGY